MKDGNGDAPDLVAAAEALETDIRKLEELSRSVIKIRLHNEKSITRAARELREALAQPERLAEDLQQLAAAMGHMQERQRRALEPLAERAAEIEQRAAKISDYMQRFAALGAEAGEATQLLQTASRNGDPGAVFSDVEGRLARITDKARALAEEARSDDLADVAREADALKQSVGALRGKLRTQN